MQEYLPFPFGLGHHSLELSVENILTNSLFLVSLLKKYLMLKVWLNRFFRIIFGLKGFNRNEIKELRLLFNNKQFELYSYKVFLKVKELSPDKYTVVNDDVYYNILAPKMAKVYGIFKENFKNLKYYEFQERILYDCITIEEILKAIEEAYPGQKLVRKE